ncbi:N-acetylglucosaminyldiphosphodolichol N-acetylglucosaminyltransferase catalytic subunit ALG13 KNAG_0D03210 [Huiozyma naganishii CBS 8797]|uniref:UDP-N-acetylglucosamine transferase subunit ALG13 n=1 Tax=Huiozyma naganishii (strain ATCC MYA-139 / BCRC 22969 / CBS 8797 / KCTC 17520 / NBRC 10181 / NCYC 3082 / Yp74L-3) TaxID=1071383 RepID=J7RY67_HUIN7|nr:hypothetical protein KNAG_0D03210 [Kazachstania naganishii CBS 8797]CCK70067.1 hypothetical protein KNAG_0D03210 [Kazachstania naganishii CBS 8797]
MPGDTLFVTCGATVPFPQLVQSVLAAEFLRGMHALGIHSVIIQFGRQWGGQFDKAVTTSPRMSATNPVYTAEQLGCDEIHCYTALNGAVHVTGIPFSICVEDLIGGHTGVPVTAIISHAGTGSILDALRCQPSENTPRPALVAVVNGAPMDNHQLQIANKFAQMGLLHACEHPTPETLLQSLQAALSNTDNTKGKGSFDQGIARFENFLVQISQ